MDTDKLYYSSVRIVEKLKPFIAIFILIFIIISSIGLYNNNQLKKEVRDSCGYELDEKIYCVCDKEFVSRIDIPNNPYYNHSENDFKFSLDPEGD